MRRVRDVSIADISDQAEIPYATLRRYLAGERNLPANVLAAVAVALNVSSDWLLFGNPWPLDHEKLATALEEHQSLRNVSGEKLSAADYAEIFATAYRHWNRPVPHGIRKEELADLGIKLIKEPSKRSQE